MVKDYKTVVANFLEAARRKKKIDPGEIFDPELTVVEAPSLPYGGNHHGVDGFNALVSRVFSTWQNVEVEVEAITGDGQYVVVLANMSGASLERATPFSMPIAEIWKFENDRVVEIKPFYFDTKLMCDLYSGEA